MARMTGLTRSQLVLGAAAVAVPGRTRTPAPLAALAAAMRGPVYLPGTAAYARLRPALEGVECIVDTATSPSPDEATATEFFTTASRNLHEAGAQAGVRRVVVVSIIGADRFARGYGRCRGGARAGRAVGPDPGARPARRAVPRVRPSAVEWGLQGAVSHVPRMRTQLVAARTVA
jgi:hypothetical protein